MNIGNALGFPSAASPVSRTERKNVRESDASRGANAVNGTAQFAAFLSLLVNENPKVREDLLSQLPAVKVESASEVRPAVPKVVVTNADLRAALLAEVRSTITRMRTGDTDLVGDKLEAPLTPTTAPSRFSQAVLSRIASTKGVTVEEMLARGDTEGAQARQGLDMLLSKAGTPEGMNIAAIAAASNALAAGLAQSAADPTRPVRDTAALDPELQSRLARVIDRMRSEYGHDVTVVETARSQERQDMLYAQGRSTPGSVVTWTQESRHTHGEAVDLLVDGNWNNTRGFERLQQVAHEEGLQTIPNDPGHLELPRDSWSSNADVRVQSFSQSASTGAGASGIARVATVARVASVASTSGAALTVPAPSVPTPYVQAPSPEPVSTPTPLIPVQNGANAGNNAGANTGNNASTTSGDSSADAAPRRATKAADKHSARPAIAPVTDDALNTPRPFIGPMDNSQAAGDVQSADAAQRIQQIDTLRDSQSPRQISQIKLQVDGPDGTAQQITVGVNGKVVDTRISTDAANAERLRANTDELKAGLERHGLEADSVRISSTAPRGPESAEGIKPGMEREALRMPGAGATGTGGDPAAQQQGRERPAARDWDDKHSARDERAQHRDAQGRGSGNQDRQRPSYQEKK
ncbi:MAG: hypothetical protein ACO1Q7_14865 [Gemmatimonas sp.]